MTLGTYTPVQNPGDIVALLQGVTFANVEDVVLTNLTTGEFSTDVRLAPDGSFTGFVPVREGRNRVRVIGARQRRHARRVELEFDFEHAEVGDRSRLARARAHAPRRTSSSSCIGSRLERIEDFRERAAQEQLEIEATADGGRRDADRA